MEQMIICTPSMSNYYLCKFFIEIIDNKKIEKCDRANDDMYTMYIQLLFI
jgi:hypothetical protein